MLIYTFLKRYIFSRRSSSTIKIIARISMFGVFLSILALIVVLSVMSGFNQNMSQRLTAAEPHLVIYDSPKNKTNIDEWLAERDHYFYSFEQQDVLLRNLNGNFSGAVAKGMGKKAFDKFISRIQSVKKMKNKLWEEKKIELKPGEVVIGYDLARSLDLFEGDQLLIIPPENLLKPSGENIGYEKVTIRYVLSTEIIAIDSKYLYYIKGETLLSFGRSPGREHGYEVILNDPNNYRALQEEAQGVVERVESWADRNSTLFFALKMEKLAMSFLLCLSAIIAGFSIVSLMVLMVAQKRREIGVLQAIGCSHRKVVQLFSRIGFGVCSAGILMAASLGVSVCLLLEAIPLQILPDIYYDNYLPMDFSWTRTLIVVSVALVLAFIAAYVPVKLSTELNPVDNLHPK